MKMMTLEARRGTEGLMIVTRVGDKFLYLHSVLFCTEPTRSTRCRAALTIGTCRSKSTTGGLDHNLAILRLHLQIILHNYSSTVCKQF